jgi:hypothetical protein
MVDYVRTMELQIGTMLVREQLLAMRSSAFGGLALLLSCIGLYGGRVVRPHANSA